MRTRRRWKIMKKTPGMRNDFQHLRAGDSWLSGCKSCDQEGGSKGGRVSPLWQDGTWREGVGRRPAFSECAILPLPEEWHAEGVQRRGREKRPGGRLLFPGRWRIRKRKKLLEGSGWLAVRSIWLERRIWGVRGSWIRKGELSQ